MATPKYHLDAIFDPHKAHPDDAHSILMRLIPNGSRVLELGCASGYLEQALGCRVTGLEFDPTTTAIARSRCSEVYTVDLDAPDALEPAKNSAPYDVLFAAAVLEHFKCPERVLQTVQALLNPEALVIVSLPNVAHWRLRVNFLFGRFDYQDYGVLDRTHLHLYTLKSGRALLENHGYRVEQVYIAGSGLQNALNAVARRTRRRLFSPILPSLLGYELIYVARLR